jgi:hypothetical protein
LHHFNSRSKEMHPVQCHLSPGPDKPPDGFYAAVGQMRTKS